MRTRITAPPGNCFSSRTAGATPLGSTSAQNLVRATERVQTPTGLGPGAASRPLNVLTSAFKPPLPSAVRRPVPFNPPTPVPSRPQQPQQQQRPPTLQQVVVKAEPGTSSDVEMHDVAAPPSAAGPSRPRAPASASETEDDNDKEGEGMPTATQAIRERIGHLAMRGQATQVPSASASHAPAGPSKASSKSKPRCVPVSERRSRALVNVWLTLYDCRRFDPTKEGATVMKRPNRDHQAQNNKKCVLPPPFVSLRAGRADPPLLALPSRGYDVVDVVLDPKLGDKMREHQKEGVKVRLARLLLVQPSDL